MAPGVNPLLLSFRVNILMWIRSFRQMGHKFSSHPVDQSAILLPVIVTTFGIQNGLTTNGARQSLFPFRLMEIIIARLQKTELFTSTSGKQEISTKPLRRIQIM